MMTLEDKQRNGLLRKYHALCRQLKMEAEAREDMLVSNFGVTSSLDLDYRQLLELCSVLECRACPAIAAQDKWRKRVMGAVGGWLSGMGVTGNSQLIKSIACRAAGSDNFNRIPAERLRSLYNAFNKGKKDLERVNGLTMEALLMNNINMN
jgi:hypothetical protein